MSNLAQERIQKTRQLVLEYLANHSISNKLNKAVNDLCRSRPRDPWLFLSDAISDHQREASLIDRLVGKNGIDNDGNQSIQLNIYGKVAQTRPPKLLATGNMLCRPKNSFNIVNANENKNENKENKNDLNTNEVATSNENNNSTNNNNKILQMQSLITEYISPHLRDFKLNEQIKIDSELSKLYSEKLSNILNKNNNENKDDENENKNENKNENESEFDVILSISVLCAIEAAKSLKKPLYSYLHDIFIENMDVNIIPSNVHSRDNSTDTAININDASQINLPNIMCFLTKSNNLPSICVIPNKDITPMERISMVKRLGEIIGEQSNQSNDKKGKKDTNNNKKYEIDEKTGAIKLNQFKKLEDLVKFVKDCIKSHSNELVYDMSFSLQFDDNFRKFNTETQKYTVFGEKKTMESGDLLIYYKKILENVSSDMKILYLEDPIDVNDTDGYTLLQAEFGDEESNIILLGNKLYHGSINEISKGFEEYGLSANNNCVVVNTYNINTISNMLNISNYFIKKSTFILDDSWDNNTSNNYDYSIDLAIASHCNIIRLPLPNISYSNNKYNRWLCLSDEINDNNNQNQSNKNSIEIYTDLAPVEEPEVLP